MLVLAWRGLVTNYCMPLHYSDCVLHKIENEYTHSAISEAATCRQSTNTHTRVLEATWFRPDDQYKILAVPWSFVRRFVVRDRTEEIAASITMEQGKTLAGEENEKTHVSTNILAAQ